jgi:hypothetical protein
MLSLRNLSRFLLIAVMCLTAVLSGVAAANAAPNEWQELGPDGGSVSALAIDPGNPQTVYAGTSGGLFKSTDAGASWKVSNRSTGSGIAIDPVHTSTIYAVGGGVSKSVDGGATWNVVFTSPGLGASCVAVDPVTPSTVYVGASLGIYKSTDSGATWASVKSDGQFCFTAIAVSKTRHNEVYAAELYDNKVYKSSDGGVSWNPLDLGDSGWWPYAVAVSPTTDAVYVGLFEGVFKSTDGGASWYNPGTGIPMEITSIAIDASNENVLYASGAGGIYRSSDAGATWPLYGAPQPSIEALALDPVTQALVYAGGVNQGVLKSADGGASWTASNNGLHARSLGTLAVNPANPLEFLAGSDASSPPGLFKSVDGGTSWTDSYSSPVYAVAYDPSNPATVFSGVYGFSKSADGGQNWAYSGLEAFQARDILINPANHLEVFATNRIGGPYLDRIYRSADGGQSWLHDDAGLYSNSAFTSAAIGSDGSVYLAGMDYEEEGPFRSGIYKRVNGVWTVLPTNNPSGNDYQTVTVAPSNPSIIYAGYGTRVSKSTNAGQTWTHTVATGFSYPNTIQTITVDPDAATNVYLGTTSGVYRSINGGATWTAFGLTGLDIHKLVLDPTRTYLYASSPRLGILKIRLGNAAQASATAVTSSATPATYGQNVTFSATVSGSGATPGGYVIFFQDGISMGAGILNQGVATLTYNALSVASHAITAAYQGDTRFVTSSGALSGGQVVNKALLTVTAANAGRSYGADNPPFGANFSGFVRGDTAAVLSGAPSFSTTAVAGSPAGSYPITVTGDTLSAANYLLSFRSGTLTVSKAGQAVEVSQTAPLSAFFSSTFTVTATSSSGLPVAISSSGSCSGSGSGTATITMLSSGSTCTVNYDQAGDGNYNAAPRLSSTTLELYPLQLAGSQTTQHSTLQSAYDLAATGDVIYGTIFTLSDDLLFNRNIAATLSGGYDPTFTSQSGVTSMLGNVIISDGTLTVESLELK